MKLFLEKTQFLKQCYPHFTVLGICFSHLIHLIALCPHSDLPKESKTVSILYTAVLPAFSMEFQTMQICNK